MLCLSSPLSSCFLLGLLALSVHLLPLNNIYTCGLNVSMLSDNILPADHRVYMGHPGLIWWIYGICGQGSEGDRRDVSCNMPRSIDGLGPGEKVWMDIYRELNEIRQIDELRESKAYDRGSGWLTEGKGNGNTRMSSAARCRRYEVDAALANFPT